MALTVKTFLNKDERDYAYYELAKTHFNVMRYGDQEEGALVQGADGRVTRQPGQMIFCIAYGSRIKNEAVPQGADMGIVRVVGETDSTNSTENRTDSPMPGLEGGVE